MATATPETERRRSPGRAPRRTPSGRRQPRPPAQPVNNGLFSTRPPAGGPPPGEPAFSPLEEPLPEDFEGPGEEEREDEDRRPEGKEQPEEEEETEEEREKPEEPEEREPTEEQPEREPPERRAPETKSTEGPEVEAPQRPPGPQAPSGPAVGQAGVGAEVASTAGTAAGTGGVTATSTGVAGSAGAAATVGTAAGGAATTGAAATTTAAAGTVTVTATAGAPVVVTVGVPLLIIFVVILLILIAIAIFWLSFAGEGLGGRTTGIPGDGQRPRDLAVTNGEILDQTILGRGSGAQGTFKPPGPIPADKDALIQALLKHPNIRWGCRSDSDARNDIKAGLVDRELLRILLLAAESGFRFTACPLKSGHRRVAASGNVSRHFLGKGADIPIVDGKAVSSSNRRADELAAFLASQFNGRYELIGPNAPPNFRTRSDHKNHIHIGVPK